jgi:hypothetical protein
MGNDRGSPGRLQLVGPRRFLIVDRLVTISLLNEDFAAINVVNILIGEFIACTMLIRGTDERTYLKIWEYEPIW